MQIKVESRWLGDVVVLVPEVFQDGRGFFTETFRADQFKALGLPTEFVQDNHSRSAKGVVRGLHFQWDPRMGKLMRVTAGSAFLVAVDIRKGSPTLGKWVGVEASVSPVVSAHFPKPPKSNTNARVSTTTKPSRPSGGVIQRLVFNGRLPT
jgi:dTDP-4-dehydrorhamnose 3,5-epimerase